ncbi:MAG: GC-type dockerin domain-anchored protein [Phycisphaerales bacterium]
MSRTTMCVRAAGAVVLPLIMTAASGQQLQYRVEVMQGMSVREGVNLRMNNHNQVVGGGAGSPNTTPPMFWSAAAGAVPLSGTLDLSITIAYDINDSGRICGSGMLGSPSQRPIVGDTPTSLHLIDDGLGTATALNNAGDIVGSTTVADGALASIWPASGPRTDLPTPGDDTFMFIMAINNARDAVGISTSNTHPSLPTIWPADGPPRRLPVPMVPQGGFAVGINLRRDVGGATSYAQGTSSTRFATLWRDSQPALALGALPGHTRSLAMSISEYGIVVGQSGPTGSGYGWVNGGGGFIWTSVTNMLALDSLLVPEDSSWHIIAACDINEHGDIAAYARQGTGPVQAVLLHPNRVNLADIAGSFGTTLPDGQLNTDDVVTFISEFFNDAPIIADLASPGGIAGPDGRLTADDVILFLSSFFGG